MKALIIVDPQNDFITGTLPVPGAEKAMRDLASSLGEFPVQHIFVTMDCHPFRHMSFEEEGGIWPVHCVKYSGGAAVEPVLMEALRMCGDKTVHFIEKGTLRDREAYSAFEESYPSLLDEADEIFVTGLAGDVCVQTSIKDLVRHGLAGKLTVVQKYCPSLDGGKLLSETAGELGLKISDF